MTTTTDRNAMMGTKAVCPVAESSVGTTVADSMGTCDVANSVSTGNCSSCLATELSGGVREARSASAMNGMGIRIQSLHSDMLYQNLMPREA